MFLFFKRSNLFLKVNHNFINKRFENVSTKNWINGFYNKWILFLALTIDSIDTNCLSDSIKYNILKYFLQVNSCAIEPRWHFQQLTPANGVHTLLLVYLLV